jgi:hypothetical protein
MKGYGMSLDSRDGIHGDERHHSKETSASEPDFGGDYYFRLPYCGAFHFNLHDAALVLVIDQRATLKGAPVQEHDEDYRDPVVRRQLEPFIGGYFQALLASIETGQLKAKVLARTFPDSGPVPERTFVDVEHLCSWLALHQFEVGDYLSTLAYELTHLPAGFADSVALERAQFRSIDGVEEIDQFYLLPSDTRDDLEHKLQSCRLKLMEQTRREKTEAKSAPLKTLERSTLLKMIIGMAVGGYGYQPNAARSNVPADIAGDLAKNGIELTDDTVRKWLNKAASEVLPKTA